MGKISSGSFIRLSMASAVLLSATTSRADGPDDEAPWRAASAKGATTFGADAVVSIPVGTLADSTGPLIGATLKLGRYVSPEAHVTSGRATKPA
jgi:hypothetical protein